MTSSFTPKTNEEIEGKIIDDSHILVNSNKNNNFLVFIHTELDSLYIQARKNNDYFNKSFSNKFSLDKIRENKYFSLFVDIKEIYNEIKEIIKIKEVTILEDESNLILSISLPNTKIPKIDFDLIKEKKNVRDIFNEISDMFDELKKEINKLKSENKELKQLNMIQNNELEELNQISLNHQKEIDELKQFRLNQEKEINELKKIKPNKENEFNDLNQIKPKPEIEVNEVNEINKLKSNLEKQDKDLNSIIYKVELLRTLALAHHDEISEMKQITLMNNNEVAELKKICGNKNHEMNKINGNNGNNENNINQKKENNNENKIKENGKKNEISELLQSILNPKNNLDNKEFNNINKIFDIFKEAIVKEPKKVENLCLFNNNLKFATDIYNISKNPLPKNFKVVLKFNSVSWVRVGITFDKEIVKDKTDENKPLYDIYYILEDLKQFYDLSHGWRTNLFDYDKGKLKSGDKLTMTFKNGTLTYAVNENKINGSATVDVYDKKELYLLVHRRDAKTICELLSIEEIF